MHSLHKVVTLSILILPLFLLSCSPVDQELTIYTNATIWNGTGEEPIQNSALLVRNGVVDDIIRLDQRDLPRAGNVIDLEGRFIIPGLINAHGHVGVADGLDTSADAESTDNVIRQLKLYARYGITTVVSLGDEPIHAFLVRDNVDSADERMARLYLAGDVLNPDSLEDVDSDLSRLMENSPDWTKIRVDDGLGTREKMSPEIYSAIIESSHNYGAPLAAHIVDLEDAKGIVRSNGDLIAHSVRDQPVDSELIDLMLGQNVCITPTLTRELSVFVYRDRPGFFDDPFFLKHADPQVLEDLLTPEVQTHFTGRSADFFRDALPLAKENMMALHNAGVRIAMGTDSGPPARFQGYFEHLEMEMMQEAGMPPVEVLTSATRYAAECMKIDETLGILESGKWADFVILDENPMDDIRNLRSIHAVYIGGNQVDTE
jgi:imidazolonepropionase-like amidohydrolase